MPEQSQFVASHDIGILSRLQESPVSVDAIMNSEHGEIGNSNVFVPRQLAERARIYAHKNRTTITNVIVEAVDTFLRESRR